MNKLSYKIIKEYKGLQLIKLDQPYYGGMYGVSYPKEKKAKLGLCLDAAIEVFNNCIK